MKTDIMIFNGFSEFTVGVGPWINEINQFHNNKLAQTFKIKKIKCHKSNFFSSAFFLAKSQVNQAMNISI